MLALMLVMGVASLVSISALNAELETAVQKTAWRLQLAGVIDTTGSDMLAGMRGIVMFTFGKQPAKVQMCSDQFHSSADRWQKAIDDVRLLLVTEEGKQLVNRLQQELTEWRAVIVDVEQAAAQGQPEAAMSTALARGLPIYDANTRDATRFRQLQNEILSAQRERGAAIHSRSQWIAVLVLGLAVVTGMVFLLVVRHSCEAVRQTAAQLSEASAQVGGAANQIASSSLAIWSKWSIPCTTSTHRASRSPRLSK
jgi:CHASE3 domain sensor protein